MNTVFQPLYKPTKNVYNKNEHYVLQPLHKP